MQLSDIYIMYSTKLTEKKEGVKKNKNMKVHSLKIWSEKVKVKKPLHAKKPEQTKPSFL